MRVVNTLFLISSTVSAVIPSSDPFEDHCASSPLRSAPADSLLGDWEGSLGVPPNAAALGLSFTRSGGAWTGTFSVPAEGIRQVPLLEVAVHQDVVIAHITPDRRFQGRLAGDSIAGELVFQDRGGMAMDVVLRRKGSPGWEAHRAELERQAAERRNEPAPGLVQLEAGPAEGRVDAEALSRLVEDAEASRTTALVILHEGDVVGVWHDPRGERPIEAMSVTKSVLSLAVGRLLALGQLDSIDTPVHHFFPQWREEPRSRITIRHLLTHTSGIDSPMPTTPIYQSGDFVTFALHAEVVSEPGSSMAYNNNATNLLAGVVGEAAGMRADRFIAQELFGPLGISRFTWALDPAGNPHGMAGLRIRARDLALLGQLLLQGGVWNGEQLLPSAWIEASLSPGAPLSDAVGLLWWLIREGEDVVGARADGYLGQYLVIYPKEGLVGVRMIEAFEGYDAARDGLPEFQELVRALRWPRGSGQASPLESSADCVTPLPHLGTGAEACIWTW